MSNRPTMTFKVKIKDKKNVFRKCTVNIYMGVQEHFEGKQSFNTISLYIPVDYWNYGTGLLELFIHELIHFKQFKDRPFAHIWSNCDYKIHSELEAYARAIINVYDMESIFKKPVKKLYKKLDIDRKSVEASEYRRDYLDILYKSIPKKCIKDLLEDPDNPKGYYEELNQQLKDLHRKNGRKQFNIKSYYQCYGI